MARRPKKASRPRQAKRKKATAPDRGLEPEAPPAGDVAPPPEPVAPIEPVVEPIVEPVIEPVAHVEPVAPIEPVAPVEPVTPVPRSGLPDAIQSVTAHGKISQVALSDDGELIAIASMSADRRAPTLAVHRTRDAAEVCAFTIETIAGNGKAACFDAAGDLLFVAGDTLFRLKVGETPERLGRVECEAMFRDAAGKWLAFVERNGAVRFAASDAPLTEVWRHDAGRGHMLYGTQVRFVGGTSRVLISALVDRGPLLADLVERKIIDEYPRRGACADASPSGDLVAVFEPRGRQRDDWFSIYAADADDALPMTKAEIGPANPIAFAPDGQQLVKTGASVQLIDIATGAATDARPAGDTPPGSTITPAVLAFRAPTIAWTSFNFPKGDFRASWASFPAA